MDDMTKLQLYLNDKEGKYSLQRNCKCYSMRQGAYIVLYRKAGA